MNKNLTALWIRNSVRSCIFAVGIAFGSVATAAPPTSLGPPPIILTRTVPINVPTVVTVLIRIQDDALIPNSVYLHRLDSAGRPGPRLATFTDDGRNGDLVAGDGELTAQFTVNEQSALAFEVAASAAFRGALKRVFSSPSTINTSSTISIAPGPKVVASAEATELLFFSERGDRTGSISLVPSRQGSNPLRQIETTHFAVISPDQSYAGVLAWGNAVLVSDNDEQGQVLESKFALYAGSGVKVWQLDAPSGTFFYPPIRPRAMFSDAGDKILLVMQGDDVYPTTYAAYASNGNVLYRAAEPLLGILASEVSSDGRRGGVIVTRRTIDSFEVVFQVFDLLTGVMSERVLGSLLAAHFDISSSPGLTLTAYIDGKAVASLP